MLDGGGRAKQARAHEAFGPPRHTPWSQLGMALRPPSPGRIPICCPRCGMRVKTHRRARTAGLLRLRIVRHGERGILRQLEGFVSFRE